MKIKVVLKSLGIAAATLLANSTYGSQPSHSPDQKVVAHQPHEIPELPSIAPNTQDGSTPMWQGHESHYSHRSHSSHQSHQSHYSSSW